MSRRRLLVSTAICMGAMYGAYLEQTRYDPVAEAVKKRAVYGQMARDDAADASTRCRETESSDAECNQAHRETLRSARSWYGTHGGAYNVVKDTETRNLYLVLGLVSGIVAVSQLRRGTRAATSTASSTGARPAAGAATTTGSTNSGSASSSEMREFTARVPLGVHSSSVVSAEGRPNGFDLVAPAAASLTTYDVDRHDADLGSIKSARNPLVLRALVQAMKEVDTNTSVTELWAMALAECNGDARAARLAYMKVRASTIVWALHEAAEAEQRSKVKT